MSESFRSYFRLRYALPGYTFLTIILLMNIEFLVDKIPGSSYSIELLGIILTFFSLVSGSAIGFLVSQPWYWYYNKKIKCPKQILNRRAHKRLSKIKYVEKIIEEPEDRISIMAYTLFYKTPDKITIYINRLNDMINSLASTISAILLGLISGHIIRYGIFQELCQCYDVIIWGFSVIFICIIKTNYHSVYREHGSITDLMIRLKSEELNKDFFKLYMRERNNTTLSAVS